MHMEVCVEIMNIGYSKSFSSLGAISLLPVQGKPLPGKPLSGKMVVPHFWMVHLVSLITPKRIEPITWDWSHFKDILEENMINSQNEGWGALGDPRGASKDQKWPKLAKIDQNYEFSEFCHHPFHSGKSFSLFLHGFNAERVVENGR